LRVAPQRTALQRPRRVGSFPTAYVAPETLTFLFKCIKKSKARENATSSRTLPLLEEAILNPGDFHRSGAFLIIVSHVIDSSAYGIATHQPSIVWIQQFGRRSYIPHPRIEPQVITVWIENDGHTVVDGRGDCIRCRCQDRTRLEPLSAGVSPSIPQSCECEQFPIINFKTVRLFRLALRSPSPYFFDLPKEPTILPNSLSDKFAGQTLDLRSSPSSICWYSRSSPTLQGGGRRGKASHKYMRCPYAPTGRERCLVDPRPAGLSLAH
jgi:hypothetical protein